MKDEEYFFISDNKEKKVTARSARNARTHCGKGGRVRLPSDCLSKKELLKMNGEVKSYRLNEPMKWDEFLALPDDIKCLYIKSIRSKYNAPIAEIQKMFGCPRKPLRTILDKLNLNPGKPGKQKWDKEGFYAWLGHCNIAKIGESSDGDISSEEAKEILNMNGEGVECQSSEKVEEDSQDDTAPCEPVSEKIVTDPLLEKLNRRVCATPQTGSLTFTGDATSIINTLVNLLRDSNVVISVKWEVV